MVGFQQIGGKLNGRFIKLFKECECVMTKENTYLLIFVNKESFWGALFTENTFYRLFQRIRNSYLIPSILKSLASYLSGSRAT